MQNRGAERKRGSDINPTNDQQAKFYSHRGFELVQDAKRVFLLNYYYYYRQMLKSLGDETMDVKLDGFVSGQMDPKVEKSKLGLHDRDSQTITFHYKDLLEVRSSLGIRNIF